VAIDVVAVTGCDGSGKSTLAAALVARLAAERPVAFVYLGQSSGQIGRWIAGLPLVGPPVARALAAKATRVHAAKARAPGLATALVIALLSRWREHKFRRMLALCRRGVLVVTDRYPQAEHPGFRFDGPGLVTPDGAGWLVRRLAADERRRYAWMAVHVPALLIRLDVDLATARARKPDHAVDALAQKLAVLPTLRFNGAEILALDGRAPLAGVIDAALAAVRARLPRAPEPRA
jgi:hypothetical protein